MQDDDRTETLGSPRAPTEAPAGAPAGAPSTDGQRGGWSPSHHVITPANRAPSTLPWLSRTVLHKLVTPRRAPAQFAECLLVIEPGGGGSHRPGVNAEHFLYCLTGTVDVVVSQTTRPLGPGGFAYLGPGAELAIANSSGGPADLLWVTRDYVPAAGFEPPPSVAGDRRDVAETDFTPGIQRRVLTGADDPCHDFSMILMRFDPRSDLGMVEIHDEEHGLWMTAGQGRYLLDRDEYPVTREDFIYMAPYCPQSFIAGGEGAEYLLYKDVWRGPSGAATASA